MFGWLKRKGNTNSNTASSFPTIDVSGPEYSDLHPQKERISEILLETGALHPEHVGWAADIIQKYRSSPAAQWQNIVRDGQALTKEELKNRGLRVNQKIGMGFVSKISSDDIDWAIKSIKADIRLAQSEASQKFDLRRQKRLGVEYVIFSSTKDERNTALENKFEGKKMTIAEAEQLIDDHGREITRSIFQPVLDLDL